MNRGIIQYILCFVISVGSLTAQSTDPIAENLNQHFQAASDKKWFMGSVLVYKDDKILLSKGYGMADMENQVVNSPSTKFRIASVTKQFTAALVLMLEENGVLSTADPIHTYFPDFPNAGRITIHHLLSHTSGIMEISTLKEIDSLTRNALPIDFYLHYIKNRPLDFEPGSKFKYSNTGYMMLTRIIEIATGKSYMSLLSEKILSPLGMKATGWDDPERIVVHRARGYLLNPENEIRNAPYVYLPTLGGAGALYSTTDDLLKWCQAIRQKKLMKPASWDKMTKVNIGNYGYGLFITEISRRSAFLHGGGVQGFASQLIYYPNDNAVIIVLKNIENAPRIFNAPAMTHAVLFGEPYSFPSEKKAVPLSKEAVAQITGEYDFQQGFKLTITSENLRIFVQIQGQPKLEAFAEDETTLFFKEIEATCVIQKNNGRVTGLTLKQGGRELASKKVN